MPPRLPGRHTASVPLRGSGSSSVLKALPSRSRQCRSPSLTRPAGNLRRYCPAPYENKNTAAVIAHVHRLSGPHTAVAVIESLSMISVLCS